jgi:hypothetical protein
MSGKTVSVLEDVLLSRFDVAVPDNLQARKVHTQVRIIRKILIVLIIILGPASVLMGFEKFRQHGTGLLASA